MSKKLGSQPLNGERTTTNVIRLYNFLLKGMTLQPGQYALEHGLTRNSVYNYIAALQEAGVEIENTGRGIWRLKTLVTPKADMLIGGYVDEQGYPIKGARPERAYFPDGTSIEILLLDGDDDAS